MGKRNGSVGSSGRGQGSGRSEKNLGVELGSICVFAVALFLMVALLTYHPGDPSLFSSSGDSPVRNACGRIGAEFVAFLFETVGIAAFLVPAALIFISTSIFRREGGLRVLATLSGMLVAVLSLTVFLTLQKRNWTYGGAVLLTGGAAGIWFVEILVKQLNEWGSSILSLLVFLLAIAASTPISVAAVGERVLVAFSRVVVRVSRVLFTYMSFILGLLAMKGAQAASRGLEKSMDALLKWAKETRVKREAKKVEALESERNALPKIGTEGTKTIAAVEHQGSGLIVDEDLEAAGAAGVELDEEEDENDAEEVELKPKSKGKLIAIPAPVAASSAALPVGELPTSVPAILPHELQKQSVLPLGEEKESDEKKKKKASQPRKRGSWKLPALEFLVKPPKVENTVDTDRLYQNAEILRQKFLDFEIEGEVTAVRPGPVITLYEFKPAAGVKVSRIASLADDISMALSAQSVRIIAPLPGKSVVGIEIPSETRENVFMKEFMAHTEFYSGKHQITVAMGKDIAGSTYFADLAKMPHLLCAGQTGSGKSVFMNGLICSLLYRFTPDELRLILVDPKMIEFASYQDIPHLLLPVVDDSSQAASALKWAVREMERRYRILAMMNVRNLASFNQRVDEIGVDLLQETLETAESQVESMEKLSGGDWQEAFEKDENGDPRFAKLPYIVIVIDELADLMMTAKKEVELSIARIAQKARAAGIHLVIATQRPSTDVVTGIIKANLPSRVSFQLASGIDSKTILDRFGAERLLGRGDMFFIPPGTSNLLRLHGAYLSDDEILKVTSFLKELGKPTYRNEILIDEDAASEDGSDEDDQDDEMFPRALELVKQNGQASASYLQRHLRIGYNRAARLIEIMEARGVVGPADGARPREVLIR